LRGSDRGARSPRQYARVDNPEATLEFGAAALEPQHDQRHRAQRVDRAPTEFVRRQHRVEILAGEVQPSPEDPPPRPDRAHIQLGERIAQPQRGRLVRRRQRADQRRAESHRALAGGHRRVA
jgi:hypothetical protein